MFIYLSPISNATENNFIMPSSRFDKTLYFDIILMPNGRDCVVISLDISFYASVAFCFHFISMSN